MAKITFSPKPAQPVSIACQDACIREYFSGFRRQNPGQPNQGVWTGVLQPTIDSPHYNIRISYKLGGAPSVEVLHPKIHERAPHRFKDHTLCLHYPADWDWTPQKFIAKTIILWAASWLYFYEHWLKSRKWLAPEAPHDCDNRKS